MKKQKKSIPNKTNLNLRCSCGFKGTIQIKTFLFKGLQTEYKGKCPKCGYLAQVLLSFIEFDHKMTGYIPEGFESYFLEST